MSKDKNNENYNILKKTIIVFRNFPKTFLLIWKSHKVYTILSILCVILQGVLPVFQLYIGKQILDSIIAFMQNVNNLENTEVIAFWVGSEIIVSILLIIINQYNNYINKMLVNLITLNMQKRIMNKAIIMDAFYFENPDFYGKLEKARKGSENKPILILFRTFQIIKEIITLIGLFSLIIQYSPLITALLFFIGIPLLIIETRVVTVLYKVFLKRVPKLREMSYIKKLLLGKVAFKEIKHFLLGDMLLETFVKIFKSHIKEDKKILTKKGIYLGSYRVLANILIYAMAVYVVFQMILKKASIGTINMYIVSIKKIQSSMYLIFSLISQLFEDNLYLENYFEFLKLENKIIEKKDGIVVSPPFKEGIVFKNVSFKYPGTDKLVLDDICLNVPLKQSVGFVGKNGSGKTTLMKLLCRFYDPTRGRIFIDGIDIRDIKLSVLRKLCGAIFQDYVKYNTTIQNNIGYGDVQNVNDFEKIKSASMKSEAYNFISQFPEQFDTHLGRYLVDGLELSGGEWQRIALSRGFMRDAEIIILDEPTAAIDAEAEYNLFNKFKEIVDGKIGFLISHRFSTIRMADYIYVMEKGKIIERGTHSELMNNAGEFSRLYNLQAHAYRY